MNNTGDCDTTTAIAGTIAGARFGTPNIDQDWLTRVELADYLRGLAEKLYQVSITLEGAR